MPDWGEVLKEIQAQAEALDVVRRKHFAALGEHTGRNVIAYYSGWLQVGNLFGTDINDMDINGFMSAICGLNCEDGLDLILHTPGGTISAAEQIVTYLKSKFGNNIRAIIPQIAMSAGTMIACSCKTIVMGKQSCLGPFDPQLNGVSAGRVLEEFKTALEDTAKNPESIPIWQVIIGKYTPTFIGSCKFAQERSENLVKRWLVENMFSSLPNAEEYATTVVNNFVSAGHLLGHDFHVSIDTAKGYGLKIEDLEADQVFQDLVLTVHHAFIHTCGNARIVKAIENHRGIGMFNFSKQQ